jgi:hypothetical protein
MKTLAGVGLVAIAAIGLGGCPAMSALSFEPAKEVVQGDDGGQVTSQLFLWTGTPDTDRSDTEAGRLADAAFLQAKCPVVMTTDQSKFIDGGSAALALAAGGKYVASLIQKGLADKVSTLQRNSVRSNKAQVEENKTELAECVGFVRTIGEGKKKGLPALLGQETTSLVVVLRKKDLGQLRYYELALAAANSTVALTKDRGEKKAGKIDLVVGLAITGTSSKPRVHTVTHPTSIKVRGLTLDSAARGLKPGKEDVERGAPFPPPDGVGLRYDMVVTEVGDLGFVPKDAQADLKNFFELVGPSYEAFVQNRVITPLED